LTDHEAVARELLQRVLGFRDCSSETISALVSAGYRRMLGRDEQLVAQNEPFDNMCVILEGSLEISLIRADGNRHLLGFLQPGDVIGLMSIVDGQNQMHTWRARQQTCLLVVPGDKVRRLRDQHHDLVRAFERQVVFRNRLMYDRLSADPSLPVQVRLANLLHMLIDLYGAPEVDGVVELNIRIAQSDLGDWLGVSRQRINFAVRQLEELNLIRHAYSTITVLDVPALKDFGQSHNPASSA